MQGYTPSSWFLYSCYQRKASRRSLSHTLYVNKAITKVDQVSDDSLENVKQRMYEDGVSPRVYFLEIAAIFTACLVSSIN
jgi:hypothetical protein